MTLGTQFRAASLPLWIAVLGILLGGIVDYRGGPSGAGWILFRLYALACLAMGIFLTVYVPAPHRGKPQDAYLAVLRRIMPWYAAATGWIYAILASAVALAV
jgi:hypothetical protein